MRFARNVAHRQRPHAGHRAWLAFLLLLSGCSFTEPPDPKTLIDSMKKTSGNGRILVGSTFPTPDNCGIIHSVRPVYPKEAKKAHIEGVVRFDVRITKTGEVGEIRLISGNPALVPAASKALKQWRYAVCRLNGEPIQVKTTVDISFTLSQ
jgi:TonB family protein